jgi:predicted N-acyltransferase
LAVDINNLSVARSAQTTIRVVGSLADIARADWDAVANPGWPSDGSLPAPTQYNDRSAGAGTPLARPYNPFVSHDFLWSLEESGCATAATGWLGQHLVIEASDGKPAAIMPCYLKSHSQGEYVFDHGWADAYARAGGRYYPKLQTAVPFTPVPGPRLLVRDDAASETNRNLLAAAGIELVRKLGASSHHATFVGEAEWQLLSAHGYLQRADQQFHFVNEGYRDFENFLTALAARKRKAVRRERRDALAGLEVVQLTGGDLTETAWDAFFGFYMDTGSRKWGRPYLNRRFFSLVGERMADHILLVLALRAGEPVAGALNFIGSDTLYGRYWGTAIEQPFLHFELCYYQAIEWAIIHGLTKVVAGAQGEHKLARGYRPTTTYSAHFIADPNFRAAVADYLKRERREVDRDKELLATYLPFREEVAGHE